MCSQKDGVAMVSPLGPVIVGIFMVDLERNVIPKLLSGIDIKMTQ